MGTASALPTPPTHGTAVLQAQDYRIQYDSIVRVFLLPKANVPQVGPPGCGLAFGRSAGVARHPPLPRPCAEHPANRCAAPASASAAPQTLVVISLDPPIRKGQTFYNHILCQVRAAGVQGGRVGACVQGGRSSGSAAAQPRKPAHLTTPPALASTQPTHT